MKIVEALQSENLRVVFGMDRWLVGDGEGSWIVYERKSYAKKTKVLAETKNESEAVSVLLG